MPHVKKEEHDGAAERATRARALVQDFLDRQHRGEHPDREALFASHGDLEPELRAQMRKLRLIQSARLDAESRSLPRGGGERAPDRAMPPPDSIPGYRLLGELHRGGQGVVYRAVQDATNRMVAIKIMRGGAFASDHDRARFALEVRILGRLNHPNIVTIHESGSVAGSTYFVMDYIPGLALDAYAAAAGLSVSDTLRFFATICDAVHGAHLRGIIHRDLKPGNIRVDPDGQPHILDFGLAKITETEPGAGGASPVRTQTGQFVGSIPWASPEQADSDTSDLDVRSDVYSLGVILYQLLTGHFPYDVTGSAREVLQRIAGAEPARPVARRGKLGSEVETIILKCLSKEPERRYQSAGDLARDIRRSLAGEPIEARRDSTWYVFRKTLRRYRIPVTLAAITIVVLGGFAIMLAGMYQEARTKARVLESFRDLMHLKTLDPTGSGRADMTVREILDAGAAQMVSTLQGQPSEQAMASEFIAEIYESHGFHRSAVPWRQRALELRRDVLGAETGTVAECLYLLAAAQQEAAEFAEAEGNYRQALALLPPRQGEADLVTARYLTGLGTLLGARGSYDEAGSMLAEALAARRAVLGEADPAVAESLTDLAMLALDQGAFEVAERDLREAVRILRAPDGGDDLSVAESLMLLASVLRQRARLTEAAALYDEALRMRRRLLGERHPLVAECLNAHAMLLKQMSRYEDAEPLYRKALAIWREAGGETHPMVAVLLNNLGNLHEDLGDFAAAESFHRQALAIRLECFGAEHREYAQSLHNLGRVLARTDRLDEAQEVYADALRIRRMLPDHPDLALTMRDLASVLRRSRRFDEAEALLTEALALQRVQFGNVHRDVAGTLNVLGQLKADSGDTDGAVTCLEEAVAIYKTVLGEDHLYVGVTLGNLGRHLVQRGDAADAVGPFREALRIHRRDLGDAHQRTARVESHFGQCLTALGLFQEAETLLLHALTTLEDAWGPEHHYTRQALERLAALYRAWERPDDAAAYEQMLQELRAPHPSPSTATPPPGGTDPGGPGPD